MDVIEVGDERPDRAIPDRSRTVVLAVTVSILGAAIVLGAGLWWREQVSLPDQAEIVGIVAVGPFAISGDDLPDDWPTDLVVGALRLRAEVVGDPQRLTSVTAAEDTDVYRPSGTEDVEVPAGGSATVDIVVTPTDCGSLDMSESPLVDSVGVRVPMSGVAREQLLESLSSLCNPGGEPPSITAESAYVDVFFRDRTLVLTVLVSTTADSVLLMPLDSPGFRARGQRDPILQDGQASARLRWLISPVEAGSLTAPNVRIRAITQSEGRAYPWVITLPVAAEMRSPARTPLRNDGVDLAEVAPRPAR